MIKKKLTTFCCRKCWSLAKNTVGISLGLKFRNSGSPCVGKVGAHPQTLHMNFLFVMRRKTIKIKTENSHLVLVRKEKQGGHLGGTPICPTQRLQTFRLFFWLGSHLSDRTIIVIKELTKTMKEV